MNKEEYRAKSIKKLYNLYSSSRQKGIASGDIDYFEAISFLSQTIDDLWKFPERKYYHDCLNVLDKEEVRSWNACIAEAERIRDLSIKGKR